VRNAFEPAGSNDGRESFSHDALVLVVSASRRRRQDIILNSR
jgi:hypothetical protein